MSTKAASDNPSNPIGDSVKHEHLLQTGTAQSPAPSSTDGGIVGEIVEAGDKKQIPAFISKLITMINDPATDHLISWTQNGKTFTVHDSVTLAKEVLPKYYKHGNFTSLVRQLNMYGFHKVVGVEQGGLRTNDQVWEFIHPCVQRDKPHLLCHVKRKDGGSNTKRKVDKEEVDQVMGELSRMRTWQELLASKFQEMERQNTALWTEVMQLRQKHERQQRMIGKIMHFLARLSQPSNMPGIGQPAAAASVVSDDITSPVTGTGPSKRSWLALDQATAEEPPLKGPYITEPTATSSVPTASVPTSSSADFPDLDLQDMSVVSDTLDGMQNRISQTRQQLEAGGMDPSFLAGLWNHAQDHSPPHSLDSDVLPELDPLQEESQSQPAQYYHPLHGIDLSPDDGTSPQAQSDMVAATASSSVDLS